MLRAIFNAIASGLAAAVRFTGRMLTAPLRWFGGGGGEPMLPEFVPPEPVADPGPDRAALYDDIARVIMTWAADSIIADGPVPLPPRMPIALREWCSGLSRAECWEIMESDRMAVSSHLQHCFAIPGVRPVQRLQPVVAWPAEPRMMESAGFRAIAELEALELQRA